MVWTGVGPWECYVGEPLGWISCEEWVGPWGALHCRLLWQDYCGWSRKTWRQSVSLPEGLQQFPAGLAEALRLVNGVSSL